MVKLSLCIIIGKIVRVKGNIKQKLMGGLTHSFIQNIKGVDLMERILAISDIHGCYNHLVKLLLKVDYNPDKDQLILLGDYVDRGTRNLATLNFVKDLVEKYGAIALRGNHDQMLLDWLESPSEHSFTYFMNGGLDTIKEFVVNPNDIACLDTYIDWSVQIKEKYKDIIEFLNSLPYYYETDKYIFVHAGINPFLKDWRNTTKDEFIWIRDEFLDNDHNSEKTVIHGHTPTKYLHDSADICFGNKKIGIDGACAYGYQLNCLEIVDDTYKQYSVSYKECI